MRTLVHARWPAGLVDRHEVDELATAVREHGADTGLLATTSTFTKQARILGARMAGLRLLDHADLACLARDRLDRDLTSR